MKILLSNIATLALALLLAACSSGFNQEKANELLQKETVTAEEYDELLQLYETGMDDAIEFSKKEDKSLSEQQRNEVLTVFAIGMRLSKDEANLSEKQKGEFELINKKGTDAIKK